MFFYEEKRRSILGIAKKKMFGQKTSSKLQSFVERGTLLAIDIAYAKLQAPNGDEKELALHAALLASARNGHLCLDKTLIEDPSLSDLLPEGKHYLPKYTEVEDQIVMQTKRLLKLPKRQKKDFAQGKATEEQQQAAQNALVHPLSLITGGPGTGKTYTAILIAKALQTSTIVTAPTGKAAAHLESQMPFPVKGGTLHSLLIEETLDANLVIVDECSMIDPFLFARILSSIPPESTLVLMGDIHQLPAVEGGSVFADLMASNTIPTTTLSKCMRSDRKEILDLANAILHNQVTEMRNVDLGFADADLETIYQKLWDYVKEKDFSRFRILSTLRKGPLGVDALNRFLFEKFSSKAIQFPILITRNDRRTGLSNGETGILQKDLAIFGDKQFPVSELPPYEYAYCISVHKSQGSEYDDVLFLIPDGTESFGREVLYTGVTRAKHSLVIDGNPEQIVAALLRSSRKISGIHDKMKL